MDPVRSRRHRPALFAVTLAVSVPLVVLTTWPQAFGAQTAPVVAQVIAFRVPLAIALLAIALVISIVAVVRRRWSVAAALAIAVAVAAVINGGVVLARGGGPEGASGNLTVVAWNTQGGAASPSAIARLVQETGAEIVSLPETDADAAAEAVRMLAERGVRMSTDTTYGGTGYSPIPTSILIAGELGEYRVDAEAGSTPGLPSAVWRPVSGEGPTIVAAHPMPPLPGSLDQWRQGLRWIADRCDAPDVIVAGDLNATVDHLSGTGPALVGGCADAASAVGAAAIGTWPTRAPAWLAAPIDHVLVGPAWSVRGFDVVVSFDDAGSDHRPVVAELERR
ncbi:endonuclease/exonuclease/phosphatase (EEP) superfamily protein YafD [Microbacterium sp. AG1240]|uniref:endonuclease/exonuclease/phosphatase family protein n=1 Tax=Microbacterium sp. AG1240 TaxID=2183992 RepID=UPI000EADB0EF|nr:endonuclease/exonuclease/phosphatase family protein [Microbacterium sp. AG1240]RKT33420.1 endonuclease/exonuclease/phosphatase (EEP) superfamily protein YafD [Microbacterium sp. AG1240]